MVGDPRDRRAHHRHRRRSAMTTTALESQLRRSTPSRRRWWRNHSLLSVSLALFFVFAFLQSIAGHNHWNDELESHHRPKISYVSYIKSGDFFETLSENWESEFLGQSAYIILTVFFLQRGSAESKDPEKESPGEQQARSEEDADPPPDAPWPVRRGGIWLRIYENSLLLVFLALLLSSIALHAVSGAGQYNAQAREHHEPTVSTIGFMGTSQC